MRCKEKNLGIELELNKVLIIKIIKYNSNK